MADMRETDVARALALHQQGRLAEAEPLYRAAIAAEPDNAEALSLLGTLCHQSGRQDEAVDLLQRAIALKPDQPTWYANLGLALRALERYPEGADALRHALDLRPDYPEAWSNLGLVQHQMSQFEEAIASFGKAIGLRGNVPGFHVNLGATYLQVEDYEKAEEAFRAALALNERHLGARVNLGVTLVKRGQYQAAEAELRQALQLNEKSAEAYRALGESLREQGRMVEALASFTRAIELAPRDARAYQGLLFVQNYISAGSPQDALAASRAFDAMVAQPTPPAFANTPQPDRRIKVGFVSADFRTHPVGQFFGHLLEHFDRAQLDITLFANQSTSDETTQRMKAAADGWEGIHRADDDAAEALIRERGIDILIDLSGHTGGNRLALFARRPAPVQMTWLGYSGTTGLSAIDYIIADASVIPPADTANYSEIPLRLPASYLCYAPPRFSGLVPPVAPTPALKNGFVTFGSYNNIYKMSDGAVAVWSQLLHAVPTAKLLLKAAPLRNDDGRRAVEQRFVAHGIDAERLILRAPVGSHLAHFESYGDLDIAVDPFPYNGTTTTCDALWMGVPLVTIDGDRFISRVGASLLRTVGLRDLVAANAVQFVEIAARLAADVQRIQQIRSGLRSALVSSPLGDAKTFASHFEAALREAWQRWCAATP